MSCASGSLLTDVASEPVEMAEVLSALDAPTRKNLNTLIKNINATTSGHEADMKAALTTAGPAVEQLGGMLSDLGTDGEAIQQILTQSNRTMGILAARQRTLSQVVNNLHDASKTVVSRQKELGETLARLLTRSLGDEVVRPVRFGVESKSRLGYGLLAAVNGGRLRMYAGDGSVEYGEFWREIPLPDKPLNVEDVRASFSSGMLLLALPKCAERRSTGRVKKVITIQRL